MSSISRSDFVGKWSLSFTDVDLINSKPAARRLDFAAQLKFFSARGFFADDRALVPHDAAEYLAEQIGVHADELFGYDFGGRTARRHCAEILQYLGYRRMARGDREALSRWIIGELCPSGNSVSAMLEAVSLWCRDHNIYDPSVKELERLVRSQRQQCLDGWLHEVSVALPPEALSAIEPVEYLPGDSELGAKLGHFCLWLAHRRVSEAQLGQGHLERCPTISTTCPRGFLSRFVPLDDQCPHEFRHRGRDPNTSLFGGLRSSDFEVCVPAGV